MGSSKDHSLDFRVLLHRSQKYFCEYLCENKNIFENILGYCSRAQVLSIYAKNQSSKITCYSPFKLGTYLPCGTYRTVLREYESGTCCTEKFPGSESATLHVSSSS